MDLFRVANNTARTSNLHTRVCRTEWSGAHTSERSFVTRLGTSFRWFFLLINLIFSVDSLQSMPPLLQPGWPHCRPITCSPTSKGSGAPPSLAPAIPHRSHPPPFPSCRRPPSHRARWAGPLFFSLRPTVWVTDFLFFRCHHHPDQSMHPRPRLQHAPNRPSMLPLMHPHKVRPSSHIATEHHAFSNDFCSLPSRPPPSPTVVSPPPFYMAPEVLRNMESSTLIRCASVSFSSVYVYLVKCSSFAGRVRTSSELSEGDDVYDIA